MPTVGTGSVQAPTREQVPFRECAHEYNLFTSPTKLAWALTHNWPSEISAEARRTEGGLLTIPLHLLAKGEAREGNLI